jgi:hypothetical protein
MMKADGGILTGTSSGVLIEKMTRREL